MSVQDIYNLIIAFLPAVTAVGSMILIVIKVLSNFKNLISSVRKSTDVSDVKAELTKTNEQMDFLLKENAELKKTINRTLNEMNHVYVPEDKEV